MIPLVIAAPDDPAVAPADRREEAEAVALEALDRLQLGPPDLAGRRRSRSEVPRHLGVGEERREGGRVVELRRPEEQALGELGRRRLISIIQPENARSIRVAERLGMAPEQDVTTHAGFRVRIYAIER